MIKVYVNCQLRGLGAQKAGLADLARAVCKRFGLRSARVGLAIVGDLEIRRLNRDFTGRNATTDCLSFDLSDGVDSVPVLEIVVNGQRARSQARSRGVPVAGELALYVVHGLLHQLGFGDAAAADAKVMHQMEDQILQEYGYGRVYYRNRRS